MYLKGHLALIHMCALPRLRQRNHGTWEELLRDVALMDASPDKNGFNHVTRVTPAMNYVPLVLSAPAGQEETTANGF